MPIIGINPILLSVPPLCGCHRQEVHEPPMNPCIEGLLEFNFVSTTPSIVWKIKSHQPSHSQFKQNKGSRKGMHTWNINWHNRLIGTLYHLNFASYYFLCPFPLLFDFSINFSGFAMPNFCIRNISCPTVCGTCT